MLVDIDLTGEELRKAVAAGAASPSEILEACIARIDALNPLLRAFVATCCDSARAEAAAAGRDDSTLLRLPVAVKDLNDVAGLPTTFGSPLFEHNRPQFDDDVVAQLRRQGGVVLGKTNVPEHGFGATTTSPLFGATGNPFNPGLSAGASTGGGAVAVASGMAPYATGSDFAGSLRTPAAFCGIAGHRPSNGVVGTKRRANAWSAFDVEGPMARTAADCKRLLSAMARRDPADPLSREPDERLAAAPEVISLAGLRVAVSEDLGFAPMCSAYRSLFRDRMARIERLFGAVEEDGPDLSGAESCFMTLRGVGFVADFGPMEAEFGERLGPVVLDELSRARNLTCAEIGRAEQDHTRIFRDAARFFERHDLLITPAASVPPFRHEEVYPKAIDGRALDGYLIWEAVAWGVTLTQCPATVIPCGVDEAGLPFGLQLVGPHGRDGWLLDIAHTLETAFLGDATLGRPKPDFDRLHAMARGAPLP
jgi:amidase